MVFNRFYIETNFKLKFSQVIQSYSNFTLEFKSKIIIIIFLSIMIIFLIHDYKLSI